MDVSSAPPLYRIVELVRRMAAGEFTMEAFLAGDAGASVDTATKKQVIHELVFRQMKSEWLDLSDSTVSIHVPEGVVLSGVRMPAMVVTYVSPVSDSNHALPENWVAKALSYTLESRVQDAA